MQFTCTYCQRACCSCSGCQPVTSTRGTICCSICVEGVNRIEITQNVVQVIQPVAFMDQVLRQRLEAQQHNRFNQ